MENYLISAIIAIIFCNSNQLLTQINYLIGNYIIFNANIQSISKSFFHVLPDKQRFYN